MTENQPAHTADALHIAANQYPWSTFYRREGRSFEADLDAGLAEVAASGADGYEGIVDTPAEAERVAGLLQKHGLEMRSFYLNCTLHEPSEAEKSLAQVLAVAEKALAFGARIVALNPNPVRWGGPEDKDDTQLRTQAKALDRIGRELKARGMTLAYHYHDIELRQAARELHHMLCATDPAHVSLCLDAHWVYRGAGDSSVALFDIVTLYGARIAELHLRQSVGGVWTETFGEGDLDYPRLVAWLAERGIRPHLVLEQAVEERTPRALNPLEAHRRSFDYARRLCAPLAG